MSRKQQAAQLVEVVRDCLRRHEQLQTALQGAGRRFRAQQDRQTFTPGAAVVSLDLYAQLLAPLLTLRVQDAAKVLDGYFVHSTGPDRPVAVRLIDLFTALASPPVERDPLGGEIDELELDDTVEESTFPAECYDHLELLLDLDVDAPRRLSGLLEEARTLHVELAELVVVRVIALAAQEINPGLRHRAPSVLIAVDDGTELDDPEYGGADLIVARAALEHAPDTPFARRGDSVTAGAFVGGHDAASRRGPQPGSPEPGQASKIGEVGAA